MKLCEYIKEGKLSINECVGKISKIIDPSIIISPDKSDGSISIRFSKYASSEVKIEYLNDHYEISSITCQRQFARRILDVLNNIDVETYVGSVAIFDKFTEDHCELKFARSISDNDKKRIKDVLMKISCTISYASIGKINEYLKILIEESMFNHFTKRQVSWNGYIIEGASNKTYKPFKIDYKKRNLLIDYPDLSRGSLCSCFWPVVNIKDLKRDSITIGDKIILQNKNNCTKEATYTITDISTAEDVMIYAITNGKSIYFLIDESIVNCAYDDLFIENRKMFNSSMRNKKRYIRRAL